VAAEAPAAFAREVRDALEHLYDPIYLRRHGPAWPPPGGRVADAAPGAGVRKQLEAAIEALRPAGPALPAGAGERATRPYRLLRLRYLEALDAPQVRRRLGVSKSQYYTDHRRAVAALVALLWEQVEQVEQVGPPPGDGGQGPTGGAGDAPTRAPAAPPGDEHDGPGPGWSAPGDLPRPLTRFVGREAEAAAVGRLLDDGARLVTLTGPGGTGKTRLAIQVAGRLPSPASGRARWRVRFVDLASGGDAGLALPAIARALGLRSDDPAALADALRTAIRGDRRLLLVLDNAEHVLGAAPQLADLLAGSPRLALLVTSRVPLRLAGEQQFPVPPLPTPPAPAAGAPPGPARLLEAAAVALFVDRAQAVRPDFTLSADNAAAVAAICRRLEGLPLAIELAAAWSGALPPPALLQRLEQPLLPLLTRGARDAPARQRTLRATIAWSHDRLSAAEQALFRRLGVFAGGCTVEAARAVAGTDAPAGGAPPAGAVTDVDLLEGLTALTDASLLRQTEAIGDPRFAMLETVREFALERLAAAGEREQVRRRHAEHFLDLVGRATPRLHGADQLVWLAVLDREADNVRLALDWCAERAAAGDADALELGLRRAGELGSWYWVLRGRAAEARRWLGPLLALPGAGAPTAGRAWALLGAAKAAAPLGGAVPDLFRECLELARATGEEALVAHVLSVLAWRDADPAVLRPLVDAAPRPPAAAPGGDWHHAARTLFRLGTLALEAGRLEEAQASLERCLAEGAPTGDRWLAAVAERGLARLAGQRGDGPEAGRRFARALALHRALGDRLGEADALLLQGGVAPGLPGLPDARTSLEGALRIYADIGGQTSCVQALERLACLDAARGDPAGALRLAGAASAARERVRVRLIPTLPADVARMRAAARRVLGARAADAAWSAGRALPLDAAVSEALREQSPSVQPDPNGVGSPGSG
jgi:predicted ATPase